MLIDRLLPESESDISNLSLLFQSFGFKHGSPTDSDFVFDVRCLPNPHWEKDLRPYTGCDQPVVEFLESYDVVDKMFNQIAAFVETWIPEFESQNRYYLTISIGCTGGQHRSVYLAERLRAYFAQTRDNVALRHREMD